MAVESGRTRRAYGGAVARSDSKAWSVLTYTLLRVAIFLVFWLPLQFLTPLRGLLAIVAALLMSGAVSLIVLDRQRGLAGQAVARFFHGINARIDASTRAEDGIDDELVDDESVRFGPPSTPAEPSAERSEAEQRSDEHAVDQ